MTLEGDLKRLSAGWIGLGLALSVASACGLPEQNETTASADPRDVARLRFEDSIKRRLRDPSSAIFNWQRIVPSKNTGCGTLNSKNGFGGFTGPEEFAYIDGVLYDSSFPQKQLLNASLKCRERATWEGIDELEASDLPENDKKELRKGYLKALMVLKEIPGYTFERKPPPSTN